MPAKTTGRKLRKDDCWYNFKASCSCPPDTRIHFRGGRIWLNGVWGFVGGWTMNPDVCDFSNCSNIWRLTGSFSNPYYYHGIILGIASAYHDPSGWEFEWSDPTHSATVWDLGSPGNWLWWAVGGTTEYASSDTAEAHIMDMLSGTTPVFANFDVGSDWWTAMPLVAVVLRNSGVTGAHSQYQPIDAANRGRSYLWMDVRKRHSWQE